jgi:hypothetical protein
MNSTSRKNRLNEIRTEIRTLQTKIDILAEERTTLDLAQHRDDFPCSCVKLNRDVEIFDMHEQSRRKRNPLSCGGFVADILSARQDCDTCLGTGIPWKHNHFGEAFYPDSCDACKYQQTHKGQ